MHFENFKWIMVVIGYVIEFSLGVELARKLAKMSSENKQRWKILIPIFFLAVIVYANSPHPDRASLSLVLAAIGYMVGWIITAKKPISFQTKLILTFIAECLIALVAAIIEHTSILSEVRSMYGIFVVTLICYLVTLIVHEALRMRRGRNIIEK